MAKIPQGPTVAIVPREDGGLMPADIETVRDFIRTYGVSGDRQ